MTLLRKLQTSLLGYFARTTTSETEEDPILSQPIPAFGDDITQKNKQVTRVAFQNIHGMKTTIEHSEEVEAMNALQIDIFRISEVNLTEINKAKKLINTILRQRHCQSNIAMALHQTDKAGYFPGGTSIITYARTDNRKNKWKN